MPSWRQMLWVPTIAVGLGIFFAVLAILYLPAFAQGRACANDVAKFCSGVKGSQGMIMQCLAEHQSELSAQCQTRVQAMETHRQKMSAACESDVQQFCKDVDPGGRRLMQCLRQHESELSPSCMAEMPRSRTTGRR